MEIRLTVTATTKRPRRVSNLLKRIGNSDRAMRFVGHLAVGYLHLVRATSRIVYEPGNVVESFGENLPGILTMWHGQHLMAPFVPQKTGLDIRVMVSRHRDGEINAIVAERFGFGTIRASAARDPTRVIEKGGLRGFLEMKTALQEGVTVAMTADVSNVIARRAGLGIIMLAQSSGRPILPVALATSRRVRLSNWDRTTFNLPFSRGACIFGNPIWVPPEGGDEEREGARLALEAELNRVNALAYERIGARDD